MTDNAPKPSKKTEDLLPSPAVNDDQDATVGTEPAKPAKTEPAEPKAT